MNVVSKSTNFAPFLKAATIAVSNGLRPVAGTGKVQRAKISVLPFIQRATNQSLSESLISGPLCVRSGVAVSSQAIQRRHAHTDIQWPDYDHYRREEVKSPDANAKESIESRRNFAYLVVATSGVAGVYGAKTVVTQFVSMLSASADVMALAKIEVKLDAIPPGMSAVFKWRGKPLFVRHRTAKEIQREESVDISTLRDPQLDSVRVQKPEWLIVLGVCTHLGCVPIANAGDYGGYYCPCHGSHYDASGRIRRGPAPANLEVPAYQFIEDNVVLVG